MSNNRDFYQNYVSTQLGHLHHNDYGLMSRYFKKNYSKFIRNLDEDILDVGCGMGHFLYFLKDYGCRSVTGIDLSQECIDLCHKENLGTTETLHRLGVEEFLATRKESFDLIVLNDVIEHLDKENIVSCLCLIKQALRKNGRVVIKTLNSANPITGAPSRYIDITHTVGFTEESMAQVLRLAEFSQIDILAQDIWVFNPIVNFVGKFMQGFFNLTFRFLTLLYGRKTTRIFTKDLIAVGYK